MLEVLAITKHADQQGEDARNASDRRRQRQVQEARIAGRDAMQHGANHAGADAVSGGWRGALSGARRGIWPGAIGGGIEGYMRHGSEGVLPGAFRRGLQGMQLGAVVGGTAGAASGGLSGMRTGLNIGAVHNREDRVHEKIDREEDKRASAFSHFSQTLKTATVDDTVNDSPDDRRRRRVAEFLRRRQPSGLSAGSASPTPPEDAS